MRRAIQIGLAAILVLAIAVITRSSRTSEGELPATVAELAAEFRVPSGSGVLGEEDGSRAGAMRSALGGTEPHATSMIISVASESGRPIENAVVELRTEEGVASSAITDKVGRATMRLQPDHRLLLIQAKGFAAHVERLPDDPPPILRVPMRQGGVLRGVVRLADGSPPESRLSVVATSSSLLRAGSRPLSLERLLRLSVTRAETSDRGGFTLEGLDPESAYTLIACGDGYVTTAASLGEYHRPGEGGIQLIVSPVWGVLLSVENANGQELSVDWKMEGRATLRHPRSLRSCGLVIDAWLASRSAEEQQAGLRAGRLLLFEQVAGVDRPPPAIDLSYSIPWLGSRSQLGVKLGRAKDGIFPRTTLVFSASSTRMGRLQMSFREGAWGDARDWIVEGTLELRSESTGTTQSLPVRARASALSSLTLAAPLGDYELRFISRIGEVSCDISPSHISLKDEQATQAIELSVPHKFGFLEVNVVRPDERAVDGVSGRLIQRNPLDTRLAKWVLPIEAEGERAWIGPLRPAKYDIEITSPFPAAGGGRSVEVQAGTVSEEWFVLTE